MSILSSSATIHPQSGDQLNLEPRSFWRSRGKSKHRFSRAVFEGTNLGQYDVTIVCIGRDMYKVHVTRRHYVDSVNTSIVTTDGYVFSVTSEQKALAQVRRFLDPTKYRTWADGTLVDTTVWEKQQSQAATERSVLGI